MKQMSGGGAYTQSKDLCCAEAEDSCDALKQCGLLLEYPAVDDELTSDASL